MAGRYYTRSQFVKNQLRRDLTACALRTAEKTIAGANALMASHGGKPGVALGNFEAEADVAASAYIKTASKSGYSEAMSRMAGGSDAKRGQYAPEVDIMQGNQQIRIAVAYAAGRSALMHEGYTNPQGFEMAGTPFLREALESQWENYLNCAKNAVRNTENVVAMDKAARAARAEQSEYRARAQLIRETNNSGEGYGKFGRHGRFFERAGVPTSSVSRVMDAMNLDAGEYNPNRVRNNARGRDKFGDRKSVPTPSNGQAGYKRKRIYDSGRDRIRFESDDEYISRIQDYYSRINDAGNDKSFN